MNILEAKNIHKKFSNHKALSGVDISVPESKVFGLLGPNGAGKTTLIRIVNQILMPDEGEISFKGKPLRQEDVFNIGYLPEERGLYKKMKVGEQAVYLARLKGLTKHDAVKKLNYWFEKFEIAQWWNRKVEELSKGMQQKIQFIVTILHEPELLIFDEPFSGFDPINANLLKAEILKLKENGSTIIFSTHNMGSVEEICDSIALINRSQKILDGTVFDIKQKYKTDLVECIYLSDNILSNEYLGDRLKVIEHKRSKTGNYLKVELTGMDNNEFVEMISKRAKIVSFAEVIPTMDDIFIKVVGEDKEIVTV